MVFEPDMSDRVQVRLPRIISADRPTRPGCASVRGAKRQGGGGSGAVLPVFGRFFAFFEAAGEKVENPLSRELNPRLPPYLEGDMTATPGLRLHCWGTGPEPPLSRPGALSPLPYPRP